MAEKGCLIMVFLAFYAAAVGLFAGSFKAVEPNTMGIAENTFQKKIVEDTVYFSGLYFLGLGMDFVTYPTTQLHMYVSDIKASTSDKQTITVDVSLQYTIKPDDLVILYKRLQQNYETYYKTQVKEAVKEEAVNWETSPDWYASRADIELAMKLEIGSRFNVSQATLVNFQLLAVDLPDQIEVAIEEQVVADQASTTASVEQEASVIRKTATNIADEAAATVGVIEATAEATATELKGRAEARAFKTKIAAEGAALRAVAEGLNFSAPELLQYMWYDTWGSMEAGTLSLATGIDGSLQDFVASKLST